MAATRPGDVIYCDPPYLPLKAAAFNNYASGAFTAADHARLVEAARACADRGIRVVISNHDIPQARELYQEEDVISISARRCIGPEGGRSPAASELLVVFHPRAIAVQALAA